ncbi:hypothetical protein [Proteus appendicitidis]|uniref:DNA transfer protein n=1 Tax=Proteus appendicitidis TaxID=3034648 RepID=A0ABY8Y3Z4_9GAMM|nr:hypothetical protein [Proteus sp. HZ0627]WIV87093.1 hypothetical protein QQS39_11435 [Proteus sp. HZ0627]
MANFFDQFDEQSLPNGMIEQGNIDIHNRPVVKNQDGSISTVRSMSANFDGREVLIPTVSDDGRIMSDDEAIDNYLRTGKHLGMFSTPEDATAYAESLHNQQAEEYLPQESNFFDQFDMPEQPPQPENSYISGMKQTNQNLSQGLQQSSEDAKGLRESVIDAFTGESKMTPEVQGLEGIMSSPEMNAFNTDAMKAAWVQMFGNDNDFVKVISNMGGQVSQDEKGNLLVDFPSGRYALNKPGLSSEDIMPFIANAVAFTPAARAPTIVGATARSAGTDLALQSSVNMAGGGDINPWQTALSAGIGGGGKAIERGLSGLSRAASGNIAPETQQLLRNAEQNGIDVLTTDVLPPRTSVGRQLQQAGEQSIGGTGNRRAIQAEQRENFVESVPQMIEQEFGIYAPHVMQGEVNAGLRRAKDMHGGVINNITQQMTGVPVTPTRSIPAIDEALQRIGNGLAPNNAATQILTNLRNRVANGASFEELRNLRTELRQSLQGDNLAMPTALESAYNRINTAMTNDMNRSVGQNLGAGALNQLRHANNEYRNIARGIEKTGLKNALEKGDITPELINNLVYSKRPSDIARIFNMVNENGRNQLRSAYLTRAYEKANGSPQRMVTQLNQLINQSNGQVFNTVFNQQQRRMIEGMRDVLEATRRASTANQVTQTGMSLITPTRTAATLLTGGTSLGIEAGTGLIARMYESPAIRNMLLRLHNTPRGSTARDRAITNIINTLTATGQAESRN